MDDQPANLLALEATLMADGVHLVIASSGFEALGQVLKHDFALILMDVKMPGMDGFETAERIRQRKRSQHTPIIFLTASEGADSQIFQGYSLGAVDYLVKPIVPAVLRSKVSVFVEIFRKTEQIRQQAELLRQLELREHQLKLKEAQSRWESDRLHEELRIARQIQQKLFPVAPLPYPGLDIAGASFPAEATGGDYFDFIPTTDGELSIVIGDVCGHGFGPALLMAELRAYLRAFLRTRTDVGEIVQLLNQSLAGDTDRFVTLFLAKLNLQTRSFVYAGAGHLPTIHLDADGDVIARYMSIGFPLAVLPHGEYPAQQAPPLNSGESILLLTDGIIEAHGPAEELFGLERVLNIVKAHQHQSARETLNILHGAIREFCGPITCPDDMTAILIRAVDPVVEASAA